MKKISQTLAGVLIGIVLAIVLAIGIHRADATAWDGTNNNTTKNPRYEATVGFKSDGPIFQSTEYTATSAAVTLTSPTVTFSAATRGYVILNDSASQTGVRPIGGTPGQVLIIKSAATNTNTMRFDDSTSMSLGGNITLTGQQDDVLALICVSAGVQTNGSGNVWARLYSADN